MIFGLDFRSKRKEETSFEFFRAVMPTSRQASYQLGCLLGSVFIDFNCTRDSRIQLVRISFDAFGCCRLGDSARALGETLSKEFINQMATPDFDQEVVTRLVKEAIMINRRKIWRSALKRYALI